jgi:hypothetical protein
VAITSNAASCSRKGSNVQSQSAVDDLTFAIGCDITLYVTNNSVEFVITIVYGKSVSQRISACNGEDVCKYCENVNMTRL